MGRKSIAEKAANLIKAQLKGKQEDLTKKRNDACVPAALEVLKMIAEAKPLMGDATPDKFSEAYQELANKILQMYVDRGLNIGYLGYVKQLALQPFDWALNIVESKMNENLRRLQVKKFGKELGDVTLPELDKMLRSEDLVDKK